MKRPIAAITISLATLVATTVPAFAHAEFQPASANAGATVKFNLFVEDESKTAGTTKLDVRFSEPLTVIAAPAPTGWTVVAVSGNIGSQASGLTYSGPQLADSANLAITLGPLPSTAGRLQFKVVQTYSDGATTNWVDDNPVGGPEPASPGPVIDILAKGTSGSTTTAGDGAHDHQGGSHDATTTSGMDHSGGSHDMTTTTTKAPAKKSDGGNTAAIVGIVVAAIVLGGGLMFAMKSRAKP